MRERLATVDPAMRVLLASDVLTTLAQMIGYLAVPWWIAQQGGARDLAAYGVVLAVASFLSLPVVAPLAERLAKRTQLVRGLAALAVSAFAFAVRSSAATYDIRLMILIGLSAVVANAFVDGASSNIAPELVPAARLPDALRLRKRATSIGRLMGPVIGGALLATAGIATTLWVYFILLASASLVASRVPLAAQPADPPLAARAMAAGRWWADLRAGMKAKWAVPLERGWTFVNFLAWIFIGPAFGLFIPLKVQSLGLSGAWLGACEAGLSIGMLIGTLGFADRLVQRFGRYRVRVGAAVSEGIILAIVGHTQLPVLLVIGFACAGFANTCMSLVGATHRALAIPTEFRVRMSSVNVMSTQIANAIGPALAGIALLHFPLDTVYPAFGLVAAVLASGFLLVPRSREFFGLGHEEVTGWYRREYPAGFAGSAEGATATRSDSRPG